MIVFLTIFSVFNACIGAASAGAAVRMFTPEGREHWASKRLFAIARVMAAGLPLVALAGTAGGWAMQNTGRDEGALLVLAPIVFLIVMGVFFAIVDFSEDGVLDFGRGPKSR